MTAQLVDISKLGLNSEIKNSAILSFAERAILPPSGANSFLSTVCAVYDSYAMRKFTGIDFLKESVPDETTLCKFRHLLEVNGLNKLFFEAINRVMVQSGHRA